MSGIEIKHLYTFSRFSENDTKLLYVLLYLPIGIILVALRAILLVFVLILGHIGPNTDIVKTTIRKLTCFGLGITIDTENNVNPVDLENVGMYVSNNRSIFDSIAVHIATGAVSPTPKLRLEHLLFLKKYKFNTTNKDAKIPFYFAPESKITNGKALLKFQTFPFKYSLAAKVQPICIRIERPILNISVNTFRASLFQDFFFYLLSPLTVYKLKFLAPLEKKSLSIEEFAEIIRQSIATELKIEKTNFNTSDLAEWEKRTQVTRTVTSARSRRNAEFQRMANQVKEVMPQVPYIAIYDDICTTESVDTTITNILEGRLRFDPETPTTSKTLSGSQQSSRTDSPSSTSSSSSSLPFNTAAKSFPKSASERNKSFQERKEQLIAEARRRYIEKHNLDIPF